jgi:hypothetical protein
MKNKTLMLEIDGESFSVVLDEEKAPIAAKAFVRQISIERMAVHSMWSGPVLLMGGINLDNAPLENDVAFLTLGDIAYHPSHQEIGIPYATTQWREPVGSVYVTRLGRIEGDLTPLFNIGRSVQKTGARKIVFR